MIHYKVNSPPLVAIVGPTASGKTELAIKLARKFNGVLISADSRQIYKGLPIGTNQPNGKWSRCARSGVARQMVFSKQRIYFVKNIPHFFIATRKPNQPYSVAQYQKEVNLLLNKLSATGYLPIIIGGTGLYVSSIVEGYQLPPGKPNFKLRTSLEKLSNQQLLKKINKLDLLTYQKIDKKNRRRLIRALEYILTTGKSFFGEQRRKSYPYVLILGINMPRLKLYQNINHRVDQMIKQGLVKEVKWLLKKYPGSPALKTIGYQELVPVIKNGADLNQVIELIKQHTRQFAKRQLTWFKKMPRLRWIKNYPQAEKLVKKFIKTP